VQDCELVGLADLNTGSAAVRQKLADYLVGLARLGVAGFRLDAAKHVQPVELDGVVGAANRTLAAEGRPLPYYFAEVIDYGGEAVGTGNYLGLGYASGGAADITEFKVRGVSDKFTNKGAQRVADLKTFSPASWGVLASDKAVVFLENHDTQRDAGAPGLGYRDGQTYRLAMVYLLGQPYGYPSVLSGYAFDRGSQGGRDVGPPSDGAGSTRPVACAASLEEAAAAAAPADGCANIAIPRWRAWCGSAARWPAPTSRGAGTTAATRSPSRAATAGSWPSTAARRPRGWRCRRGSRPARTATCSPAGAPRAAAAWAHA
jgi:alpha-amylase